MSPKDHHPLIGLVPDDDPPLRPVKAPEPRPKPLTWCSDCDCPADAHAPSCPALRRSAAVAVTSPKPEPVHKLPTWREAAAKALRRIARRLEDGEPW